VEGPCLTRSAARVAAIAARRVVHSSTFQLNVTLFLRNAYAGWHQSVGVLCKTAQVELRSERVYAPAGVEGVGFGFGLSVAAPVEFESKI